MRSRQSSDAGFSLVELIVVVLIMAIISGGATISISVLYNANVDRAAKNLCAVQNEARQQAMAGSDTTEYFTRIYIDSDDNYCADICSGNSSAAAGYSVLSTTKLGNNKMVITIGGANSTSASRYKIAKTGGGNFKEVRYVFEKDNGAVKAIVTVAAAGGAIVSDSDFSATDTHPDYVDIYVEGNDTAQIVVVQATGRCYLYGD